MELKEARRRVRKAPFQEARRNNEAQPAAQASINYAVTPRNGWYLPLKAVVEYLQACILLILTSPIVLIAAVLVRFTSSGPAFYRQTRVGKNGRLYTIFKLRTMYNNCEAHTGPKWSTVDDPRITPVGRFLRATHIDEFPQVWNVLRGEMSLVGPRPERPEFVAELRKNIPEYDNRLAIRPGITGLAQVNLPPDTDLASVRRKLMHDLFYVHRMNPWLDLRLMLATFFASLGFPSPVIRAIHRALFLPTQQSIRAGYEAALGDQPALAQLEPA